jgi:DNA-binding Xre family transcriptional regulator
MSNYPNENRQGFAFLKDTILTKMRLRRWLHLCQCLEITIHNLLVFNLFGE